MAGGTRQNRGIMSVLACAAVAMATTAGDYFGPDGSNVAPNSTAATASVSVDPTTILQSPAKSMTAAMLPTILGAVPVPAVEVGEWTLADSELDDIWTGVTYTQLKDGRYFGTSAYVSGHLSAGTNQHYYGAVTQAVETCTQDGTQIVVVTQWWIHVAGPYYWADPDYADTGKLSCSYLTLTRNSTGTVTRTIHLVLTDGKRHSLTDLKLGNVPYACPLTLVEAEKKSGDFNLEDPKLNFTCTKGCTESFCASSSTAVSSSTSTSSVTSSSSSETRPQITRPDSTSAAGRNVSGILNGTQAVSKKKDKKRTKNKHQAGDCDDACDDHDDSSTLLIVVVIIIVVGSCFASAAGCRAKKKDCGCIPASTDMQNATTQGWRRRSLERRKSSELGVQVGAGAPYAGANAGTGAGAGGTAAAQTKDGKGGVMQTAFPVVYTQQEDWGGSERIPDHPIVVEGPYDGRRLSQISNRESTDSARSDGGYIQLGVEAGESSSDPSDAPGCPQVISRRLSEV